MSQQPATIALILLAVACSASNEAAEPPGATTSEGGATSTGGRAVNNYTGYGGAYVPPQGGAGPTHPLFGAGNYTSVDTSDPCYGAVRWALETNLDLGTGTVVRVGDTLWRITAPDLADTGWVTADCEPPTTVQWCNDKYGWEEVGTCDPL